MREYWNEETPVEIDTGRNIIKYFEKAAKLQISMPYWRNDAGEQKQGKTVTLDLSALKENPDALKLMRQITA